MANLTGTPTYVNVLRQLETTDPAHPNTWNPNYQALLNNDVYLKGFIEGLMKAATGHTHSGVDGDGAKIPIASLVEDVATQTELNTHIGSRGSAHAIATTTEAGFMSATDKSKLDGVAAGANNYVHPTTDGNMHVPATGTTNNGKVLKAGATAGSASWSALTASDIPGLQADLDDVLKHNNYGTATGTNTLVMTLSPAPTSLVAGLTIRFKNTTANTGAVTLNVNSLGAKSVLKSGGVALAAGNLKAGGVYTVCYDGTNFILQGEGGSGTALASDLLSGKTASSDAGDIVGTIPSKAAQTYTPGTTNQTIAAGQYLSGAQTIDGDADLIASNIKSGVNIFGVVGSLTISSLGGKEWASGSGSIPTQTASTKITVNNLSFAPSILLLAFKEPINVRDFRSHFVFVTKGGFGSIYDQVTDTFLPMKKINVTEYGDTMASYTYLGGDIATSLSILEVLNANGFEYTHFSSNTLAEFTTYNWMAFS